MLTGRSIHLIAVFSSFFLAGLAMGNQVFLFISLLPLTIIIFGLITDTPGRITMKTRVLPPRVWVGDILEVKTEIQVERGLGPVTFYQELPPHFAMEEGNNLRVFWKGWQNKSILFTVKIRCTKRGFYTLPPVLWRANHALRLTQTGEGSLGEPLEIPVHLRIPDIRRIRGVPGIASSPFPVIDMARVGVTTTDFREIREYVCGDPVKNINWKATARQPGSRLLPLVNEYEVEGKKTVWLFLDASWALEVGTNVENAFEYCLQAASGVTYYFLDHGYRVGLYIFNDGEKLFYPDTGKKQFLKISRELLGLQVGRRADEFPEAVEKCKRYILGYNPLCVVVTRLDSRYSDSIITGVKKIYKLRGRRRRKLPVIAINIPGYSLMRAGQDSDVNSSILMQLNSRPRIQQLRRLGASVVEWNPRKNSFGATLLRQVKTR